MPKKLRRKKLWWEHNPAYTDPKLYAEMMQRNTELVQRIRRQQVIDRVRYRDERARIEAWSECRDM